MFNARLDLKVEIAQSLGSEELRHALLLTYNFDGPYHSVITTKTTNQNIVQTNRLAEMTLLPCVNSGSKPKGVLPKSLFFFRI
jgi:hypothetical protein